MNKQEKRLVIIQTIYLAIMLLLILSIFLCILLKVNGVEVFLLSFIIFGLVGYIVIAAMRTKAYTYKCPCCNEKVKMNFVQSIFSKRYQLGRKLKCPHCNEKSYMERIDEN
jgi:uncharacterized membrane protein